MESHWRAEGRGGMRSDLVFKMALLLCGEETVKEHSWNQELVGRLLLSAQR